MSITLLLFDYLIVTIARVDVKQIEKREREGEYACVPERANEQMREAYTYKCVQLFGDGIETSN